MAVRDNFNRYYTELLSGLQEEYPELKGGTVYTDSPPSFPYLYFRQIDGATAAQTLSNTEEAIRVSIQAEIYSADSAARARAISAKAREIMASLGFRCSYYAPVENVGDTSLNRFIGRYEKIDA